MVFMGEGMKTVDRSSIDTRREGNGRGGRGREGEPPPPAHGPVRWPYQRPHAARPLARRDVLPRGALISGDVTSETSPAPLPVPRSVLAASPPVMTIPRATLSLELGAPQSC